MAILGFNGNLHGRTITDSTGDVVVESSTGNDVIVNIETSTSEFKITNDVTLLGKVVSTGISTLPTDAGDSVYDPVSGIGAYANSLGTTSVALDSLFTADFMIWNELSPNAADGSRTTFNTSGNKVFTSGKVMVFVDGVKKRPSTHYTEGGDKHSVIFFVAPVSLAAIEFTYVKG